MRGTAATLGTERVAPNGYHYVKVERDGKCQWVLKHWLVMEDHLGRLLTPDERVRFKSGNRDDLTLDNLELVQKGDTSIRRRLTQLYTRRDELSAQIADLEGKLDAGDS